MINANKPVKKLESAQNAKRHDIAQKSVRNKTGRIIRWNVENKKNFTTFYEKTGTYWCVSACQRKYHGQSHSKHSKSITQDALKNKDWTLDPVCHLTESEFAFWEKIRR